MERISLTSFGHQPVAAGLLAHIEVVENGHDIDPVSKWQILRDATAARTQLGIGSRTLGVLSALLSFHKGQVLEQGGALVVFPSNRTLSDRAHGMAESTLRRHLAALVEAGLILRHDSPNGKRYARRGPGGDIALAFGFDLSPLLHRANEIAAIAHKQRETEARLKTMRERCVLMQRDLTKLIAYGQESGTGDWSGSLEGLSDLQRQLRRKPTDHGLRDLEAACKALLKHVRDRLTEDIETSEVSACDSQNERHQQSSNTDSLDSELTEKTQTAEPNRTMPLPIVLKACDEISLYATDGIRTWADLITAAAFVKTMMGISDEVWHEACDVMGACDAATVVACLLQRVDAIKSPGGYLRVLTQKAEEETFRVGPMVMALLNAVNMKSSPC